MQTLSPFDPVRPQRARLALLAASALAAASPGRAQETERASLDPSGAQFTFTGASVDASDDGSLCCFYANPIGGSSSLYIRDLEANATTTLRPGVAGYALAMSGDGNCVVWSVLGSAGGFPSFLAPGDTNGTNDIYKFPTDLSAPVWVSVSASGGAANMPSWDPDVSWDGNLVTFSTYSGSNMTANPSPPGGQQVYLRDIPLQETRLISITPGGSGGNGSSNFPVISDTGRYVAFQSDATDLVPGDTNNYTDIFVWDDLLSTLTLVSRTDLGAQANLRCVRPSISEDGRFVLYTSSAGNLSPDSQFGLDSLYVLDRDPDGDGDLVNTLGVTTMVSRNSLGVPVYGFPSSFAVGTQLSNDGTQILFNRYGDGLEANYTGYVQAWLHDRTTGQTTNVHVDSNGLPANHSVDSMVSLAGGGSRAVYRTNASNFDLVLPDTNGQIDVYAHQACPNPARDLGYWIPGTGGISPELSICGELATGDLAEVRLRRAKPNSISGLVRSSVFHPHPFVGGTLVPGAPVMRTSHVCDGIGAVTLLHPGGGGPATEYWQWVVRDRAAPGGFSFSNALEVTILP